MLYHMRRSMDCPKLIYRLPKHRSVVERAAGGHLSEHG
ncbi:hypothetical protein QE379_001171 [Sphingomonas sp. SORGH_AS 879]|nr:hypothetical protein [Sphingomonas sp. SORGH_AS_0879]